MEDWKVHTCWICSCCRRVKGPLILICMLESWSGWDRPKPLTQNTSANKSTASPHSETNGFASFGLCWICLRTRYKYSLMAKSEPLHWINAYKLQKYNWKANSAQYLPTCQLRSLEDISCSSQWPVWIELACFTTLWIVVYVGRYLETQLWKNMVAFKIF